MRRTAETLIVIAVALAAGGAAAPVRSGAAQAAAGDSGWVKQNNYESVHFTITSYFKDDDHAERLQKNLERYFSRLQKEFWDFIDPLYRESHISVAAFATQARFDAFAEVEEGLPRGEKGYSSLKNMRIAFVRQDAYHKDIMILVHELTHLFNAFSARRTPVWLDEGMAQFYANYAAEEAGNTSIKGGVNTGSLETVDAALKDGTFVHISELIMMDDDTFYGQRSRVNYAESWALVYYMRRGLANGDTLFSTYYIDIARGQDPYASFTKTYGVNQQIFRRSWISFLERIYRENVVPRAARAVR